MTISRLFHIVDAIAVALGIFFLVTAFVNISPAEAAATGDLLTGKDGQPFVVLLGFTLTTLPVSRRLAYHALLAPGEVAEYQQVGMALHRIALHQRVQAGNLYLSDMDDVGIRNIFDGDKGLWEWLGPAYADPKLRSQIHPTLLRRLEGLAAKDQTVWAQA